MGWGGQVQTEKQHVQSGKKPATEEPKKTIVQREERDELSETGEPPLTSNQASC